MIIRNSLLALAIVLAGCNDKQQSSSNFAMLGDSVISLMAPFQPSLAPPFNTAVNLGIGQQTSTQIAARVGTIPAGTQLLLLEGGINNLDDPDTIVSDYVNMLSAISPAITIFFLGIIQLDEVQLATTLPGSPLNNMKIDAVVARLNAVCAAHANCHPQLVAQTGSMVGLTLDGLHPNGAGYSAIVSRILTP
jgi:lysophospholipase L1-like esterase